MADVGEADVKELQFVHLVFCAFYASCPFDHRYLPSSLLVSSNKFENPVKYLPIQPLLHEEGL